MQRLIPVHTLSVAKLGSNSKRWGRAFQLLKVMATQDLGVKEAASVMCIGEQTAWQYSGIVRHMFRCKTLNGAIYKATWMGLI